MMKLCAVLLLMLVGWPAYASFGGVPCNRDFVCHFVTWGLFVGVAVGLPVSCVAFVVLHILFCNPERSKATQAALGGVFGLLAYEIAAAGGAFSGSMGKDPMSGLLLGWAVLAIASVLWVRTSPK